MRKLPKLDGWICAHRQLRNWYKYDDSEFVHIWLHLLLLATHKPYDEMWGKDPITLQPGQFLTCGRSIAGETGIPPSNVERVLKSLALHGQIRQEINPNKKRLPRLTTILNWGKYQNEAVQRELRAVHCKSNAIKESGGEAVHNLVRNNKGTATAMVNEEKVPKDQGTNYLEEGKMQKPPIAKSATTLAAAYDAAKTWRQLQRTEIEVEETLLKYDYTRQEREFVEAAWLRAGKRVLG